MHSKATPTSYRESDDAFTTALSKHYQTSDDAAKNRALMPKLYGEMEAPREEGAGRVVPMSVLNLSMPRTGTMTMQRALEILGYRCYHSTDSWLRMSDIPQWNRAQDAKFFGIGKPFTSQDWDHLLGEYSAVSADPPAIAFAEELIETYPDAKVILVDRDIDKWFDSFSSNVTAAMWSPMLARIMKWDPDFMGEIQHMHERWVAGWMHAHSREEMDMLSKDTYRKHVALVRQLTPKDRLLEYKLDDGWEPLCKFLGHEVPDCPFPNINDSEAMWAQITIIAKRGLRKAVWKIGQYATIGVAVSAAGWWMWQRR